MQAKKTPQWPRNGHGGKAKRSNDGGGRRPGRDVEDGWRDHGRLRNARPGAHRGQSGRCAVMALERVLGYRKEGGVARMASIKVIREIMKDGDHPRDGKVRIGPFSEAESVAGAGSGLIDESESADAGGMRRESHLEARLSSARSC